MSMDIDTSTVDEDTTATDSLDSSPKKDVVFTLAANVDAQTPPAVNGHDEGGRYEGRFNINTLNDGNIDDDIELDKNWDDIGEDAESEVSAELPLSDKASTVEEEDADEQDLGEEAGHEEDGDDAAAAADEASLNDDHSMGTALDEPDIPDDNDTQETSFVPDSMYGTPTPSLPPLSSPTLKRLDSLYRNPSKQISSQLHSPSKLRNSQTTTEPLNGIDGLEAAMEGGIDSDNDDNISLQSDLTIPDLDPQEWKTMIIAYGAEPRPDDYHYFNSLIGGSSSKPSSGRSRKISNTSNGSNRSSSRLRKPQISTNSPSLSSRGDGRAAPPVTPLKGQQHNDSHSATGSKVSKTYGKRSQRTSTDTTGGSDSNVNNDTSRRTTTDGTETSGESSAIEVTSARKPGVLREWTPDEVPGLYMQSPSKVKSDKKGKGRASDLLLSDSMDIFDQDKEHSSKKPAPTSNRSTTAKSPKKPVSRSIPVSRDDDSQSRRSSRNIRQKDAARNEVKSPTPSPAPSPPPASEPFKALSTATGGRALTALEIIAQMKERAKHLMEPDSEEERVSKSKEEEDGEKNGNDSSTDSGLDIYGGLNGYKGFGKAVASSSDSDDDLMDANALISKAKIAATTKVTHNLPEKGKEESGRRRSERNVASGSINDTRTQLSGSKAAFTRGADVTTNKSKQALAKIFKARQAEEARGWRGIAEASREEEEAEAALKQRSGSTSSLLPNGNANGEDTSAEHDDSEDDSDSSALPDELGLPGHPHRHRSQDRSSSKKAKPKRQRRPSNGQIQRLVNHLGKSQDAKGAVEAIKLAQDEQLQQEEREKAREEARSWSFWKDQGSELLIQPFTPYETRGCSGLDYALRKGILDGIKDPAAFPVELISPYISSTQALKSTISATYTLYQLVAHPCTDARLANRVLPMLRTLLTRLPVEKNGLDTDVDLGCVVASLTSLGAKTESFDEDLRRSAAIESDDDGDMEIEVDTKVKVAYSVEQRAAAMLRTMTILRTLIETRRIPVTSVPSLTILLLRMSLVSGDCHVRETGSKTLLCLWDYMLDTANSSGTEDKVLEFGASIPIKDRYRLISFLPLNTELQRVMMKRLCFGFVFTASIVTMRNDPVETPSIRLLADSLKERRDGSHSQLDQDRDGSTLYYSVILLQYMCTDMSKLFLASDDISAHGALKARRDAEDLVEIIQDMDSKLRTDTRSIHPLRNKAKNALARMQHSIEYQLNFAFRRSEKIALQQRLGAHSMAKPTRGRENNGQLSLEGFFGRPPPEERPETTLLQA